MNSESGRSRVRILVVEDSEDDYHLLLQHLRSAPFKVEARRVEEGPAMQAALLEKPGWDLVISDHNMPRFSSTLALQVLRRVAPDLPFIIASGMIGEEAAVEALKAGADDYVMKGNMARLVPSIERALRAADERRAKRAAEDAEKRALEELRESRERLSQLTAHLEKSKEEERAAISREIHDELGGLLTGLKADLAWIRKNAPDEPRLAEKLRDTETLLDEVVAVSRRIAKRLRPAILDQGLNAALEWQAREFEKRAGIACRFQTNDEDLALETGSATGVFRVFQEALTNVAKHSRASNVDVQVFATDELVTLEIHDDGVGVKPQDLAKPDSFGLRGMQERVHHLGGWLDVSSAPGRGTTLMLSIPRASSATERDE
jgi:signal transduction histidine kinase